MQFPTDNCRQLLEMYNTAFIVSPRAQLIKCILYVSFYIIICLLLLKVRNSFYLVQQSALNTTVFLNKSPQKQNCLPVIREVKSNSADLEIKLLENDEMNGQSINSQGTAAILQQVSQVCTKNNLKTPLVQRHFLYSSENRALYCWIRKAASTSFTKLFSDMRNRQRTRDYYKEVDFLSPKNLNELQRIINNTNIFKLLVVRHPFQRLVSSYRDRIEDNSKYTAQAWIYTKKIFNLTRPHLLRFNATTGNFMQKVFTHNKKLKIVPTFREFLEWLLHYPNENDVHWDQYYTHCAVCNVTYNYILKLDDYTFGEINYIFSKFGLDKSKVYLPNLEETRGGYTDFRTVCKYLGTLTQDIVLRLYERYKIDFEMFNYNLKKYLYCVKRSS